MPALAAARLCVHMPLTGLFHTARPIIGPGSENSRSPVLCRPALCTIAQDSTMKYIILLATILCAYSNAVAQSFSVQHPLPLPAYYSDVTMLDSRTILVSGSEMAVQSPIILRSENAGESWDYIDLPTKWKVNDLFALSESDIWAAGYDASLLHSSDGGRTWESVSSGFEGPYIEFLAVHFTDELHGWVVGRGYQQREFDSYIAFAAKTADGGKSWTQVEIPKVRFEDIQAADSLISSLNAVHFDNPAEGWLFGGLIGGDEGVILRTTDGGSSFQQVDIGLVSNIIDFARMDDATFLAAGARGTLLRSTDNGEQWQQVQSETSIGVQLNCITAHGTAAFAVGGKRRIFRSTDSGANWQQVHEDNDESFDQVFSFQGVDFADANNGWAVGSNAGLFRTADGGDSWRQMTRGVIRTLYSIFMIDELRGLAGGADGTLLRTVDGGLHWDPLDIGADILIRSLHFINERHGWLTSSDHIFRSDNGGETWTRIFDIPHNAVIQFAFVDENNGWMTFGKFPDRSIQRTVDGGDSWTVQTETADAPGMITFVNDSTGWALTEHELLHTKNYGESWDVQIRLPDHFLIGIDFLDESTGWVTVSRIRSGTRSTVYFTSDGGEQWTDLLAGDPESDFTRGPMRGIAFNDRNNGWLLGFDNEIYRTPDAGRTWEKQAHFLSVGESDLAAISALPGGSTWFAGSNGFILRYGEPITDVVEMEHSDVINSDLLIFPNPTGDRLLVTIPAAFNPHQTIEIAVVDLMGRTVLSGTHTANAAGHIELNLGGLRSGLYMLQLYQGTLRLDRSVQVLR